MKPKLVLSLLSGVTLVAVLSVIATTHFSGKRATSAGLKTFSVHGEVRGVDFANKRLRVAHDEIPDYMPAMVMPLEVKDPALLHGLAVGDEVQFELSVTEEDSWISRVQKVSPTGAPVSAGAAPDPLQEREAERIQSGEVVPDFQLLDQDGQVLRLKDLRGTAVVLTFIYTRCPLPNFCPLMSKNFADLEQRLSKELPGKYRLLSVTMDPEFDRPAVLKDYASRYDANPRNWTFATGDADQIQFVAGLMGLYYAKENGLISHDLRTALISPDGRLVHLWKSNVWTPYEVQRMVREVVTGARDTAAR